MKEEESVIFRYFSMDYMGKQLKQFILSSTKTLVHLTLHLFNALCTHQLTLLAFIPRTFCYTGVLSTDI